MRNNTDTPPREARDKIKTLDALAAIADDARARDLKVVLCHGVYDLVHMGHVRHLEAARREGDVLIVTTTTDHHVNKGPGRPIFTETLRAEGHDIRRLDLGGGLGIPYTRSNEAPPLPVEYGALIKETVGHLGCEVEIEPGRLIAGNAGILVSKVIYVKQGEDRQFLILDGAMNDLIRPAMYDAWHDIVPVIEPEAGVEQTAYDIVGPVCESGDTFAKGRMMAPLAPGALVAFRSAGAYGAVMASEYNTRPLIPEVLVRDDKFAVIRARPTFDEMINRDTIPEWL